jgi:hypothetical protein
MLWKIVKHTFIGLQNMFWWSTGWCSLIAFIAWLVAGNTGLFIGAVIFGTVLAVCIYGCLLIAVLVWAMVLLGFIKKPDAMDA